MSYIARDIVNVENSYVERRLMTSNKDYLRIQHKNEKMKIKNLIIEGKFPALNDDKIHKIAAQKVNEKNIKIFYGGASKHCENLFRRAYDSCISIGELNATWEIDKNKKSLNLGNGLADQIERLDDRYFVNQRGIRYGSGHDLCLAIYGKENVDASSEKEDSDINFFYNNSMRVAHKVKIHNVITLLSGKTTKIIFNVLKTSQEPSASDLMDYIVEGVCGIDAPENIDEIRSRHISLDIENMDKRFDPEWFLKD